MWKGTLLVTKAVCVGTATIKEPKENHAPCGLNLETIQPVPEPVYFRRLVTDIHRVDVFDLDTIHYSI